MNKILSVTAVVVVITSQMGCASKVTKVSQPINQIEFDGNYTYSFQLKDAQPVTDVGGSNIAIGKDRLKVTADGKVQTLMNQDVARINGVSNKSNGNYAWEALKIGAISRGVIGALMGLVIASELAGAYDAGNSASEYVQGALTSGALGAGYMWNTRYVRRSIYA